jgi:hypothetical protein
MSYSINVCITGIRYCSVVNRHTVYISKIDEVFVYYVVRIAKTKASTPPPTPVESYSALKILYFCKIEKVPYIGTINTRT